MNLIKIDKEYYNLKELIEIVNLKYTQLKKRVKFVLEKYNGSNLIYKKSNKYFIHKSLIKEFRRKRKQISYKLFLTISPEGYYTRNFLRKFVMDIYNQIKRYNPLERLKWVYESNKNGLPHLHILTTFSKQIQIRKFIKNNPLGYTNLNLKFVKILDDIHLQNELNYMKKENNPELFKL